MTRLTRFMLTWAVAAAVMPAALGAQAPPAPTAPAPAQAPAGPAAPPAAQPPAPGDVDFERITFGRPAIRIGQDYLLRQDAAVREAVIIMGDARIEGRVDQNVVVILGNATVTDTAFIDDSLVVIGGTATVAPNARIDQDLVIVGGELDAPAGFTPRGEYIVVGSEMLGGRLQAIVPWITRGLLWGRLIVPDVGWIWGIVFLFLLGYAALNLVFDHAIVTTAQVLTAKPLTAFAVGILVMLLFPPVAALLAVSVIGIPVIPILVCGMVVAGLLGRVAVARWIGMNAVKETEQGSKIQGLRSLVIGFGVVCVAYMVPILGLITFATLAVLGLGAATLAFMNAYRRENPAAPKRTPPPMPPSPVTPPFTPGPTGGPEAQASYMSAPAGNAPMAHEAAVVPPPPAYSAPPLIPPMPPPPAGPSGFATVTTTDMLSLPKATFLDRIAALVLDAILVGFVLGIIDVLDNGPGAFFFFLVVYHIGCWTWKAATLGGVIMNLRVIRMDGYRLRFVDALVRGLSAIFSAIVVGLGFFWILRDPERQAWHDRIAGTYVLKVPRQFPL
jgi:uncharacterized RDD family membrane protein YckC